MNQLETPSTSSNQDGNSDIFADDNDIDFQSGLPFPKPLDRSSFLTEDFDATEYLTELSNSRFQTLEDLQADLKTLLTDINKELVDLVNDNYVHFIELGERLGGGEEKVEEVRVSLLGFKRDVEGVRETVTKRRGAVEHQLQAKRSLRNDIAHGNRLLEIHERTGDLEARLGLDSHLHAQELNVKAETKADPEDDEDSVSEAASGDFDEEDFATISEDDDDTNVTNDVPHGLKSNVEKFLMIIHLRSRVGAQNPFMLSQKARLEKIRDVLQLDIDSAARAENRAEIKQKLVRLRAQLNE